jgi:hypothetical protein
MEAACSTHARDEKYRILVGKPEQKRPHGGSRHRWEDDIRMDLSETEWEDVDWIHVVHDRDLWWGLVGTVMRLRVTISFSTTLFRGFG